MSKRQNMLCVAMAGLLVAAGVSAQSKKDAADDSDQKELYNYVLTMDKLQKWGKITKELEPMAKQHPEMEKTGDAKNLDEMVKRMQQYPEVVAVMKQNDFTPREYCVFAMTVIQAGMAVGFKKSGQYKEYPPEMLKIVSKPN